jgi:omega-hydroxy-beta-dihydromenaquinone-9 sulfotransferase
MSRSSPASSAALGDPLLRKHKGLTHVPPSGVRAGNLAPTPTAPPHVLAKQPEWTPRIWNGCDFLSWIRLLIRNRFAIHPRYWYIAVIVTILSLVNSLLRLAESVIFGRAVRNTTIDQPLIFLLGHWRTGTTLLHELMACDENLGYPNTYQCMEPNHFLLTERLFARWLRYLIPATRPMDDMEVALDRPQEDEFAMCLLGAASPLSTIAFPNRASGTGDQADLETVSPAAQRRWKRAFHWFVQKVAYKTGRRLVLKSPPHTARIRTLKEMFPDSMFIHIVRDPYVVFASTMNLWRTLYKAHGLQTPSYEGLEERVLSAFACMHEKLEEGKQALRPGQFYELRYEDLIRNPVAEIEKIYAHFRLPGFDACLPRLHSYLSAVKEYATNTYDITEEQRSRVTARWHDVIRRYGYA